MAEPKEKLKEKKPKTDLKKMVKKNKKEVREEGPKPGVLSHMKDETKQGIYMVVFFLLALLTALAAFHGAGPVGEKILTGLRYLFGIGYYLLPLVFFILGISFLKTEKRNFQTLKTIGGVVFLLSSLGIIDLVARKPGGVTDGGIIGWLVATPMDSLFAFWASLIIFIALIIISCLVLFETKFTIDTLCFWKRFGNNEEEEEYNIEGDEELDEEEETEEDEDEEETESETPEKEKEEEKPKKEKQLKVNLGEEEKMMSEFSIKSRPSTSDIVFVPPPLALLEKDKGKPGVGDIKANANIIKRTLQNFGIDVEMDEISIGPSITRYALKPAEGVKLSRIVALQNDLSLALAAHPIRIEAPIPGKSLVGIEIPNTAKTTVGMASLLSNEEYQTSEKPLLVALGKGISGKSHFANLAKMPHCLIAGTTGSGKSVTIHTIINSLLFRNSPETLKFMMIDPKRVELTLYNKIPHLLTPVITEAKKAILALRWAAKEMDRRYDILEAESCKDIDSYHKNILAPEIERIEGLKRKGNYDPEKDKRPETMPYIVIVIDELADIMMTYPKELESAIVRLAQMSRAVGIHLILSTQRPSVNVITGLIKANIPSRIALQVASQIDSRTILDCPGAEKLLGAGDMLYLGGEMSKPARVQSAYISETEVKKVVKYLTDSYRDAIPELIDISSAEKGAGNVLFSSSTEDGDLNGEDEMYEAAKEEVTKTGKASTSYLQRKLGIGYSRAAKLVDMMEERGFIGPSNGSKAREVYGAAVPTSTSSNEEDVGGPEETEMPGSENGEKNYL